MNEKTVLTRTVAWAMVIALLWTAFAPTAAERLDPLGKLLPQATAKAQAVDTFCYAAADLGDRLVHHQLN